MRDRRAGYKSRSACADDRADHKGLKTLRRYVTPAALSDERVQINAAVRVELKLTTPWRDGATHHLVMTLLWAAAVYVCPEAAACHCPVMADTGLPVDSLRPAAY